ncbi:MAG: GNAT family N-acetyltransferase [Calditrichaceae bacterium]|nr:GNAT family N-acetyltransferase [Calditrichia bacterium]NUQ43338.1 GNAT family N-acetyltransferase [Calditrichaceae bacterium]
MQENLNYLFRPLGADNRGDFEKLFGKNGACGGCWCMFWRLARAEFSGQKGEGNRQAMKKLIESGETPGILAYLGDEPVGWCSVAPREKFPALERSRVSARIDDQPVWSITCFFIHKNYRRKGLSLALLRAAVDYVREQGGKIVEGYPVEPKKPQPGAFVWTGLASAFRQAGFQECARRSETRPLMRLVIGG